MSIVLIALGFAFFTGLSDRYGALGLVFIILGSLFLIMGLWMKNSS